MSGADRARVPARMRARYDEVVAHTDAVAATHLDAEYAALCRRMAGELARQRPSPLERGSARTWAAGVLHAVGWVNFLGDPGQTPHLPTAALAAASGVGKGTLAAVSRTIRNALGLMRFDPEWTRPSRLLDKPLAWLVVVDGVALDLRDAPLDVQVAAFEAGLIPFVPHPAAHEAGADSDEDDAEEDAGLVEVIGSDALPPDADGSMRAAVRDAEEAVARALEADPDTSFEELNAVVGAVTAGYNQRGQEELGGLSPVETHRLLEADWVSAESAIRLDETVPFGALSGARTLHDARLLLAMLAEGGPVKTTAKGNLPRVFVDEFRARMRPLGDEADEASPGRRVRGEDDLFPLRLTRALLELAGLVKRRGGVLSRTRRGERLADESRGGELFATLVVAHFRRLDLAVMDGVEEVPEFQYAVGYTLYRFGRVGGAWKEAAELAGEVLLPFVREAIPPSPYVDLASVMLEMRFLRPLEWFGLAAVRPPRGEAAGPSTPAAFTPAVFRKTALFDRVVRFHLDDPGDG